MTAAGHVGLLLIIAVLPFAESHGEDIATAPITCLAMAPAGTELVEGSVEGLRIRRWDDFSVTQQLPPTCLNIHDVQFNPAATLLAVVGGDPAEFGQVEVYSWPELKLRWRKQISADVIYSVAFHDQHNMIAVGGHDHRVHLLNAESGEVMQALSGHSKAVMSVVFLKSHHLISGSLDQTIRVWNTTDGSLVRSLTNHTRPVNQLCVAPQNEAALPLIASAGDDRAVRFWQPTIGRMVSFHRLSSAVTAAAWSSDGESVYAGTADGQVIAVHKPSLQTKVLLTKPECRITSIAVHPAGAEVVVGTTDGHVDRVSASAEAK